MRQKGATAQQSSVDMADSVAAPPAGPDLVKGSISPLVRSAAASLNCAESASYDVSRIERKWQQLWREAGAFATPRACEVGRASYVFVAPPFTSGDAHMGHVRSYAIGDAHARFLRSRGDNVLFALGFDAFGLPAELGAIEREMRPQEWVEQCCDRMREQFDRLGLSFDWERQYVACDPHIYRWSQWLFLELLAADLIYQRDGNVDWCESCRTVLASTQVEDGSCWRCHGSVRVVQRKQWYLRLSAYNEENERRIDEFEGWNDTAIAAQRSLLGRTDGIEFDTQSVDGLPLVIFTPFPDAVEKAEFIAIALRYPDLSPWIDSSEVRERLSQASGAGYNSTESESIVIPTGREAYVPGAPRPLPVVLSPSVDARYGPTIVLGIPELDRTDAAIAARLPKVNPPSTQVKLRAVPKRPAIRYRASDFTVSRQRAWGTPIPIIHCETCGMVPASVDELPVELPDDLMVSPYGNALAEHEGFVSCVCPQCGASARRETDTLDFHMDVAWCYMPLAIPPEDRTEQIFDHPDLRRWLPASLVIAGVDTGGFTLAQRMVAKGLRDVGLQEALPQGEPYKAELMHQMVRAGGRKMSKHLHNGVSPQKIVEEVGADVLRFAVLHAAAPDKSFSWGDSVVRYSERFLTEVWEYAAPRLLATPVIDTDMAIDESTAERRRLRRWCHTAIERITENYATLAMHRATRNVVKLMERIQAFERQATYADGSLTDANRTAVAIAVALLVQLLSPVAPHMAEELWSLSERTRILSEEKWPDDCW